MVTSQSSNFIQHCYLLRSRRSIGVDCDPEWFEHEAYKSQCVQCGRVRPDHFPKPLDQVVAEPPKASWIHTDNLLGGFIWRRDLLEILRPWLKDCIYGRVFLRNRGGTSELQAWATCYLKPGFELFESRGRLARHRPCDLCGFPLSRNGATAQRILVRDIQPDRIAMESQGTMFLHPKIEAAIDWKPFRDAYRGKVKLIDAPEDGQCLPGDPDWAPGKTRFADPPPPDQPQYIDDPDDLDPPVLYD